MNINSIPRVTITWMDARDMETGWMVVNNDEKIVIMRSWCTDKDDNHGGGAIAIPKGWVTKIEYLQGMHADVRN